MPHNFSTKTVLITGGSRGQGAAEARMFASAGARVVIGDVVDDEGVALARSITQAAAFANTAISMSPASRIGATPSPSPRANSAGCMCW